MLPEKMIEDELSEAPQNMQISTENIDYSEILKGYGLEYKRADYYLQVGAAPEVQGWILHISVVLLQVKDLLNILLPVLITKEIPFKIPADESTAEQLLSGMLGYTSLGKIVTIYPGSDIDALHLARQLIALSTGFKGPDIPTDIHLGGVLYTRYGAYNPVLQRGADGNVYKCIYNQRGELMVDNYTIPFILPEAVSWPFTDIKSYSYPAPPKLLHGCIKPLAVIKHDVKGRVIKGLYVKNWLQAKYCLIKEGKMNMCADRYGRDIRTRLEWQYKLHSELAAHIPVPRIIDYYKEGNDLYLVMEFIDGDSLNKKIMTIYDGNSWRGLAVNKQVLLLDYLLKVIKIVQQLHDRGYVHRDLTSVNFLCDKKDKLYLTDLELTYDLNLQAPDPAFWPGTQGFMSPEQKANKTPTVKEDVYGIGALMIMFFTGLLPSGLDAENLDQFRDHLHFFIPEKDIVNLIADCVHSDPSIRPALATISGAIQDFRSQLLMRSGKQTIPYDPKLNEEDLKAIINKAVKGICSERMTKNNGLWFSKDAGNRQVIANYQASYSFGPGFYEGISGVLWMLARLKESGIAGDSNIKAYYQINFDYIRQNYLGSIENMPAGLFTGSAGTGLMLSAGMGSGLLTTDNVNLSYLRRCMEREPEGLDLINGAAGQGIAFLQCMPYLPEGFAQRQLKTLADLLLDHQQKDGLWRFLDEKGKHLCVNNLGQGSAGIICFLLTAGFQLKNDALKDAATKALYRYQKQARKKGSSYTWALDSEASEISQWAVYGIAGIILMFIKAYELLGNSGYKKMAESVLNHYPLYISSGYLNHDHGLTGLGEVYLEAWRVFKDETWKKRAEWIAHALIHQRKQMDNGCYWLTEPVDLFPTADLITGNSGITYFLARCLMPDRLPHPLLPTDLNLTI